MKKYIFIALFFTTNIYAQNTSNKTNRVLLLNSQEELMSGRYSFDDQSKIRATFIPFNYHIDNNNEDFTYTLKGAVGIGKHIIQNTINDFYSIKLGLQVAKRITENTRISTQIDILYSKPEGKRNFYYGLKGDFFYQPTVGNYKPYIKLITSTFSTQHVKNINDIKGALLGKIQVGVLTPHLTSIGSIPLRIEPFFLMAYMSNSIKEKTGTKGYYKIGLISYLGSNPIFDWIDNKTFIKKDYFGWIDEITLETSYIHGNNFNGFNIGFGISF